MNVAAPTLHREVSEVPGVGGVWGETLIRRLEHRACCHHMTETKMRTAIRIVVLTIFSSIGLSESLAAWSQTPTEAQYGSWVGPEHSFPAASCHPHCKILGSGKAEGEDYTFDDDFPANVVLDASKATVDCIDTTSVNSCAFDGPLAHILVDNVSHKVHIKVTSHSGPASVRATVPILSIAEAKAQ